MMSIAILFLGYCKHKHGQVRGFCTILTKINDIDNDIKFRVLQPEHGAHTLMCKNSLVANPVHVHGVFIYAQSHHVIIWISIWTINHIASYPVLLKRAWYRLSTYARILTILSGNKKVITWAI